MARAAGHVRLPRRRRRVLAGAGRGRGASQSDVNGAPLLESLAGTWLPAALPGLHARMAAGEAVRVADVGCGGVHVDGYDVDGPTVALARANVERERLADRVRVLEQDLAAHSPDAAYDLVMAYGGRRGVHAELYGYSVLVCLPDAMSGNPEGATGTVMRPATMDRYAREAGFAGATPLPVDHELWRFYELMR